MSEWLNSDLLAIIGSLLGVLVGGLLSFLTTLGIEHRRWKQKRQEKLEELRRDALAEALEWIEPMRNAEIRVSSLVMAAIHGEVDHENFLKKFPDLIGDLAKKDLSASQRAVLPDNVYARGHQIVRDLNNLRSLGVKYGQEAMVTGKPMAGFQECNNKLDVIGKQIEELETDLRKAFRQTFK